jgi:hypothetical protein
VRLPHALLLCVACAALALAAPRRATVGGGEAGLLALARLRCASNATGRVLASGLAVVAGGGARSVTGVACLGAAAAAFLKLLETRVVGAGLLPRQCARERVAIAMAIFARRSGRPAARRERFHCAWVGPCGEGARGRRGRQRCPPGGDRCHACRGSGQHDGARWWRTGRSRGRRSSGHGGVWQDRCACTCKHACDEHGADAEPKAAQSHWQTAAPEACGQCVSASAAANPQCMVRHGRSQVLCAAQAARQAFAPPNVVLQYIPMQSQ